MRYPTSYKRLIRRPQSKALYTAAMIVVAYLAGFVQDFTTTPQNAQIKGKACVHDGDSLTVGGRELRLFGIDAPELKQKCYSGNKKISCGVESRGVLEDMLSGKDVFCSDLDTDQYKRTSGNCYFINGAGSKINIGQEMVKSGYALAYRTYSMRFVVNEQYAKAMRRGIWQYSFKRPWNWRRNNR